MMLSLIKSPGSDTDIAEASYEYIARNETIAWETCDDLERRIYELQQELIGWTRSARELCIERQYRDALQQEADHRPEWAIQYTFDPS